MAVWKNLYLHRHAVWILTRQMLLSKYRQSILGILWAWITPVGMVVIIAFVFSSLFGQSLTEFVPFVFAGLTPWMFFTGSAESGAMSFVSAEGYIKQISAPAEIFPAKDALFAFVNMLIALMAYYLFLLLIAPGRFTAHSFYILPVLPAFLALGVGIAIIAAVFNTHYRDYAHFQSLGLQALFYLTPIIYPPQLASSRPYAWVFQYNPMWYVVDFIRYPLLGEPPPGETVAVALGVILLVNVAAMCLMSRTRSSIVSRL